MLTHKTILWILMCKKGESREETGFVYSMLPELIYLHNRCKP